MQNSTFDQIAKYTLEEDTLEYIRPSAKFLGDDIVMLTFLRSDPDFGGRIVYFGPMGCRTGFYLLLAGEYTSAQIVPLITSMYEFIRDFEGDIPGAAARDCGNYLDQNPGMAAWLAARYLENTLYCIDEKHLVYPE